MSRLVAMTSRELADGYRLAGAATVVVDDAADAATALRRLLDDGECGVIAVHRPFLEELEPSFRRALEELRAPLVVGLPAGEAEAGEDARRTAQLQMLWRAVGYEITFDPEGEGG